MGSQTLITLYCIFLLSLQRGLALRCRSGNQQTEDQFQSILQACRRRPFGQTLGNSDSDSSENDTDNSSSSVGKGMFNKNNNGKYPTDGRSFADQYHGYRKNDRSVTDKHPFDNNDRTYQSNNMNSSSSGDRYDNGAAYKPRSFNSNQGRTRWGNDMDPNDFDETNNKREPGCVIQCFFDELNVVDHRGFPEKQLVARLMMQNIHDPELRDFIKESITQCFRFLNSDVRKEKCSFSQNLMSCLAEKGKERCDDWDD